MHYFATCTIEAGDEIVISYLDQLWSTTREGEGGRLTKCRRCLGLHLGYAYG